jgi:hypothetical protein
MTPIERISSRSKALSLLGITGNPTKTEIRQAFRKLAFEKHPDHGKGSPEEFARISDAYALLSAHAVDALKPVTRPSSPIPRPALRATETRFDADTVDLCDDLLGETGGDGLAHVATRLYRKGRILTYFVPTPPGNDLNRVALPTGDLEDKRRIQPRIVDIWHGDLSGNVYDVPPQIAAQTFPGARAVQIRFGSVVHH